MLTVGLTKENLPRGTSLADLTTDKRWDGMTLHKIGRYCNLDSQFQRVSSYTLTASEKYTGRTRGKLQFPQSSKTHISKKMSAGVPGIKIKNPPEGSGEQGKMEETGCEIICGAPTTLAVKG